MDSGVRAVPPAPGSQRTRPLRQEGQGRRPGASRGRRRSCEGGLRPGSPGLPTPWTLLDGTETGVRASCLGVVTSRARHGAGLHRDIPKTSRHRTALPPAAPLPPATRLPTGAGGPGPSPLNALVSLGVLVTAETDAQDSGFLASPRRSPSLGGAWGAAGKLCTPLPRRDAAKPGWTRPAACARGAAPGADAPSRI